MKRSAAILSTLLLLAGCSIHKPPTPDPVVPPPAVQRALGFVAIDARTGNPITGAAITAVDQAGVPVPCAVQPAPCATNSDGYLMFTPVTIGASYSATATAAGYRSVSGGPYMIAVDTADPRLLFEPVAPPDPWLTVTAEQLALYRGSISTVLGAVPCGPRPGRADNVIFTAQYDSPCNTAADRATYLANYKAEAYTHWAIGPIVQNGYHGRYPDTDWRSNPAAFLDRVEEVWRAGFYPVVFLLPDTGVCADGKRIDHDCVEREFTPIYSSPRFQQLARYVVLAWEPNYAAEDWQWGVKWMARVFPNARREIHFETGHGAPCLGAELAEAGGPFADEATCWRAVAPYIHGYLQQETWTFGGQVDDGRTPEQQFVYDLMDTARRFTYGSSPACLSASVPRQVLDQWDSVRGTSTKSFCAWNGNAPTTGADGSPLLVRAFEYGSYYVTNDPAQRARALAWGDLAAATFGVTGYGDGGTKAVQAAAAAAWRVGGGL